MTIAMTGYADGITDDEFNFVSVNQGGSLTVSDVTITP